MCAEGDGPAQHPLDGIPAEPESMAGESRIPHKFKFKQNSKKLLIVPADG